MLRYRRRLLSCHADRHQPPNADWIRKDYGSKSVTIQNITQAYAESSKGNGFIEEFIFRPKTANASHCTEPSATTCTPTCTNASPRFGAAAPGVKRRRAETVRLGAEEARADLFQPLLHGRPEDGGAGAAAGRGGGQGTVRSYISNGMMTQLARVELGKDIEQTHMRNRKMISEWAYELGRRENVIEKVVNDRKTYIVVNDFDKLRTLSSERCSAKCSASSRRAISWRTRPVERYGVKVDRKLHEEVLERYGKLGIQPYSGFCEPDIHSCHGGRRNRGHHLRVPEKLHGTDADYCRGTLSSLGELTRGTFFRMPAYPGSVFPRSYGDSPCRLSGRLSIRTL